MSDPDYWQLRGYPKRQLRPLREVYQAQCVYEYDNQLQRALVQRGLRAMSGLPSIGPPLNRATVKRLFALLPWGMGEPHGSEAKLTPI